MDSISQTSQNVVPLKPKQQDHKPLSADKTNLVPLKEVVLREELFAFTKTTKRWRVGEFPGLEMFLDLSTREVWFHWTGTLPTQLTNRLAVQSGAIQYVVPRTE